MKRITLILLLLFGCAAWGQTKKCDMQLLFSSKELREPTKDTVFIRHIGYTFLWKKFKVKLKDKSKKTFALDSIWGYKKYSKLLGTCLIYRNYKTDFYKLEDLTGSEGKGLIIYSKNDGRYTHNYFSFTFDSPVYRLDWTNFTEQFKDNPCMLEKIKSLKVLQSASDFIWKDGNYRAIEWYDACK